MGSHIFIQQYTVLHFAINFRMTCHMKLAILVLIVINQALSNAELVNTDNNPFFKRFHQVNFDSSLSEQHHRARRSADPGSQSVRFKLETHGK